MDKYKKVKSLVSKETCEVLGGALLIIEPNAPSEHRGDAMVPKTYSRGGYSATDSLLFYLRPKIEEITGFSLHPTTSYCRVYRTGDTLFEHTDRPACEVSVTLNLKQKGENWSIIMGGEEVFLEQGDGVVYMGQEIKHSRNEFMGEYHAQVFLHYVKKDGDHAEWKHDKRVGIFDPFV